MPLNIPFFLIGCLIVAIINVFTAYVSQWLWSKGQERSFKSELYFIVILFILLQIYSCPYMIIIEK
jgi:hypothetical protein